MAIGIVFGLCLYFVLNLASAESCSKSTALPDAATIKEAAEISTGNKMCPSGTKFFPQPIHHDSFSGDWHDQNETYLQQYEIIDKFFKPGGPVLFYQTPEDPLSCLEGTSVYEWAKELGALAVSLEHRYFGLSCPYGLNFSEAATWETGKMDSLTLDNVLSDGVAFMTWLTSGGYPGAKGAKVIVIGASYGAALAALYRTHHPEIIYGAVAAAPPTKGIVTDPYDPLVFGYSDWVNMVYNDLSAEAAQKIRQSAADIRERIEKGNFDGLQEALHLCNAPNSTNQSTAITGLISNAYIQASQYNFALYGFPMNQVINKTLALDDSVSIIGAAVAAQNTINRAKCAALNAATGPVYVRNSFDYIICTYMPYPRTNYNRAGSIFGQVLPDFSSHNINEQRCREMWGISAKDGGAEYQRELGIDKETLRTTTRLLISQGLYDPITAMGPGMDAWLPAADRDGSRVLYVGQSGHATELLAENATDPQAVKEARVYELNSVKEWLGVV